MKSTPQPEIFCRLLKVDEEHRLIYGRATEEVPDRSREVFDYKTSKPYFEKWSSECHKDSGGKSFGNLRAMHQPIAAGKLTSVDFVDAEKAIDVCAHVVDDAEWDKVMEGVYTGFSIGGRYVKRWDDKVDGEAVKRFTADPAELSLVDRPCVPTAKFFDVVKADGTLMKREFVAKDFTAPTTATSGIQPYGKPRKVKTRKFSDVVERVTLNIAKVAERKDTNPKEGEEKYGDVKFADEKNKKYPIDTEKHIRAAWNYINKEKNQAKYSSEDVASIKAKIVSAWKEKIDKDGPPSADEKSEKVHKGMRGVAYLASLISQLNQFTTGQAIEESTEGDDSELPEKLKEAVQVLSGILAEMAIEESDELDGDEFEECENPYAYFYCADGTEQDAVDSMAKFLKFDLEKRGARNSKADQMLIQHAHDTLTKLGAMCEGSSSEEKADMADDATKAAGGASDEPAGEAPKRGTAVKKPKKPAESENAGKADAKGHEDDSEGGESEEGDDAGGEEDEGESKPAPKKIKKADEGQLTKADIAVAVVETLQALGILQAPAQKAQGNEMQSQQKRPALTVVGKDGSTQAVDDPDAVIKAVGAIHEGKDVNKTASLIKAAHAMGPTGSFR